MRTVILLLIAAVSLSALDTISISAVPSTFSEAATGAPAVVRVSRASSTTSATTVDLSIASTEAVLGVDYSLSASAVSAVSGSRTHTVTIPANQLSVDINVSAIDDAVVELGQSIVVTVLSNAGYLRSSTFFTTLTLADDDLIASWNPIAVSPREVFLGASSIKGAVRLTFRHAGTGDALGTGAAVLPSGRELSPAFRVEAGAGQAELGDDYVMTYTLRHAGSAGSSIIDGASVDWNSVDEEWTVGPRVTANATQGASTVSVSSTANLRVDDFIRFGEKSRIYRITSIGGGTIGVAPPIVEASDASDEDPVRNNLDVGISNNGDLQQVGMDETYAELDVAFTAKYDGTPEGGESITLRLISSSDFIVESPNDIAVPLADDDLLVWMEAARDAVRSPLQEGLIRLSLSSAAPKAITAFYSVAGTAVAGTDYTTLSGSVLIPQGATAVDIPVSTLSGSTGEGTVQATIVAGSADYVISGSGPTQGASATINVLQGSTTATPDAVVSIATTTASAADAPAGTLSFTLTAVRSGTTNPTIEVPVLVGGSAVPGTDYTAVPATLSLPGLVIGSEVAPSATFINLRTTSGTHALAVGDTLRLGSLGSTYTVKTAASLSTTAVPVELTAAVGAGLPASSSAGVTRRVYSVPVTADATAEGNETITVAMVDTSTGNNFNLNSSAQSITLTITDTASGGGSAAAKPSAGTGGGCSAGGASALLLAGGLFVVGLRRRRR